MTAFGGWCSAAILSVCVGMRAADRREVFATRADEDPHGVFADLYAMKASCLSLEVIYARDGLGPAVGFFGVFLRSPGVGSAVMLATPQLRPMQARAVARRVRRRIIPEMVGLGLRRVDCQCLETHEEAQAFLRWCGARRGDLREGVGKHGECFREFRWLAREWRAKGGEPCA
jgi:RimJ/RimL family protein N-acetyltransferase